MDVIVNMQLIKDKGMEEKKRKKSSLKEKRKEKERKVR